MTTLHRAADNLDQVLDSFLYQYAIGGAVFALGIGCGFATRQLSLARGPGRTRLLWLSLGMAFFIVLQGALVLYGK